MSYGFSDSLEIKGLVEVQQRLTAFGEKIANVVTQKALNAGARIIQKEAVQLAPVWGGGPHNLKVSGVYVKIEPGNLKKQIRIRTVKKVEKGTKAAQIYVKQKQAWYAKFVEGQENGTSRQAPQPFMRPAYENKKDEAVDIFKQHIEEAIVGGGL